MEKPKTKEWLQPEDRLDPANWHTSRRENAHDYEQRQTPAKWAAILTAVINYQNKHHGMSPTDLMISHDTGLSPGQVQYHLREMEKNALVKDSKGWPRILTVENATKVQRLTQIETTPREITKEARTMDTSQLETQKKSKRGGARYSRTGRKPFMVRAREIAEAITDHYDQYGKPPDGPWLKEKVFAHEDGRTGGGSLSRIVQQMVDLGWLHHKRKHQRDYAVTGLGRAALFGMVEDQLHTDTPVNPVASPRNTVQGRVFNAPPSPAPRPSIPRRVFHAPPPPVEVTVRRAEVPPSAPVIEQPYLKGVSDVDLIIEVTRRGYKVSR